jgi:hypothetical protein
MEKHADELFTAELQFRLATAVRLAVSRKKQPLVFPTLWTHGKHSSGHKELALRQDQADFAAFILHRSATHMMAMAIKEALGGAKLMKSENPDIRSAWQISRMIRNAFAHHPFWPKWSIDADCANKVFAVSDVISLDTHGLNGRDFDWRHYGGLLALYSLSRWVRKEVFGQTLERKKKVPAPREKIYQQSDLILTYVKRLPKNLKRIPIKRRKDGGIPPRRRTCSV